MYSMNPLLATDSYKLVHRDCYPPRTELVYSNFTPRKSRVEGLSHMVFFGLQYAIKEYLIDRMNRYFFNKPKEEAINEYKRVVEHNIGKNAITFDHIESLHDLGYLPLEIKALPEGTFVPLQTPAFVLFNTHPKFFWLTNYFETLLSSLIWKPCTSATTSLRFRKSFEKYAELTGAPKELVSVQGHDFSFRGMSGLEDVCLSGAGHALAFQGSDNIPVIPFLEKYYNANLEKETIVTSVPATEHSVVSAGGQENELDTLSRLLDTFPTGIISLVSDTWDLFKLVTEYLPQLRDKITNRQGLTVIRPDSGVPHKIINGDPNAKTEEEKKGVVRLLDENFGHTINKKGFKQLNHVGTIYGDSINFEEQDKILSGLVKNGYVSTTTVLGLGSFTYQFVTRDTLGTVCKATHCQINGEHRPIFKSPKTGGWKKSHKGLLRVNNDLSVTENVGWENEGGLLKTVFKNGNHYLDDNFNLIRMRAKTQLMKGLDD